MNEKLHMVDLKSQYFKIKEEIDEAVIRTLESSRFIGGGEVTGFADNLAEYTGSKYIIPCANGTDALQIALMALDLKHGDEVIVPAFTYVATAEVIALLNLKPVLIDVEYDSFNINAALIKKAITPKTKAVIPVHLFGQSTDMEDILILAKEKGIAVIEDNAQAIGASYTFNDGQMKQTGTMGEMGTTSFFPSKNLGCFGDGGAIYTQDDSLANRIKMIANHGQSKQYYHDIVGVNSRLDSIQAAILNIKLKYLDAYAKARIAVADQYDAHFGDNEELITPFRKENSTHVFHQYTLKVQNGKRNALRQYLLDQEVPHNIYYPVPLYEQKAYASFANGLTFLKNTDQLCKEVISLPIHTEMNAEMIEKIADKVNSFFIK